MSFENIISNCEKSEEECIKSINNLVKNYCPNPSDCAIYLYKTDLIKKYEWVERLIKSGVPDGRARLILYVISRYLINIKKLNDEDALNQIYEFINNSCKNYSNCTQIYKSWLTNVIRKVKDGKWKPWTLEKLMKSDPELYKNVKTAIG
ncbi:MAG: DNA primase noncatalytic subunit PriX [Caldisphaera sp.]|jgi:hypothetical protein|nr:DNA primase noncatalytic subunit PriX [Caldisphaera sp.]PMP60972.1 MAG: hypothetical protein C0201_01270 [Caldisphaera sp.]